MFRRDKLLRTRVFILTKDGIATLLTVVLPGNWTWLEGYLDLNGNVVQTRRVPGNAD
jgi:hypothetical protein